MNQDDVLQLFRQHADSLGPIKESQRDIILLLAQVLAASRPDLSRTHFNSLVHVGAVMYQEGLAHFNARSETETLMKEAAEKRAGDDV